MKRWGGLPIALSLAYATTTVVCVIYAVLVRNDDNAKFFVLQIPIVFQKYILDLLGYGYAIDHVDWLQTYLLIVFPTFCILALIDFILSRLTAQEGHSAHIERRSRS